MATDKCCTALKPILISEGIYRSYCTDEEIGKGVKICVGQELRLNLLFTIAAVAANVRLDLAFLLNEGQSAIN